MGIGARIGVVSSGLIDVDLMAGGFWAGDLILIGGGACAGKTALALNIAEHVLLKQSLPVTIFSTDMTAEQIFVRLLCSTGRISLDNMRSGDLTEHERPRLERAISELAASHLHIEHSSAIEIGQLLKIGRGISKTYGKQGLIVVDFVQFLSEKRCGPNQRRALGTALRELKRLAMKLRCPVIALSPLGSEVDLRPNKRPVLSDLGPVDLIGTYADVAMLVYRDEVHSAMDCQQPGLVEVTFPKRRDGSTGVARLVFLKAIARYEALAPCW